MKFFEIVNKQNLFELIGIDNDLVLSLISFTSTIDEHIQFKITLSKLNMSNPIIEKYVYNRTKVKQLFKTFFASKLTITDSDIIRLYDFSNRKDSPFQFNE